MFYLDCFSHSLTIQVNFIWFCIIFIKMSIWEWPILQWQHNQINLKYPTEFSILQSRYIAWHDMHSKYTWRFIFYITYSTPNSNFQIIKKMYLTIRLNNSKYRIWTSKKLHILRSILLRMYQKLILNWF